MNELYTVTFFDSLKYKERTETFQDIYYALRFANGLRKLNKSRIVQVWDVYRDCQIDLDDRSTIDLAA